MSLPDDLSRAARAAAPIALGYVSIGLPCGVMAAQAGVAWWQALLLSATFYSGAGQFMMSSMALSGASLASIIASVTLVGSRQMLYSAAFSPHLADAPRPLAALFAATVTDESFGVNLDAFASGKGWTPRCATLVNLLSMSAWALANAAGCAAGAVVSVPVATMSFAMTSIFVCLLVGQRWNSTTVVVVLVAFAVVAAMRLAGAEGTTVLVGSLAAVAAGLAWGARSR